MAAVLKVPLTLEPLPAGGYTVTSPLLPELVTEGRTAEEAVEHVRDALTAVMELYEDLGRALPVELQRHTAAETISFDYLIATA